MECLIARELQQMSGRQRARRRRNIVLLESLRLIGFFVVVVLSEDFG